MVGFDLQTKHTEMNNRNRVKDLRNTLGTKNTLIIMLFNLQIKRIIDDYLNKQNH